MNLRDLLVIDVDVDAVITRAEIDEVTAAYRRPPGFARSALRDDPRALIDRQG